jgi:hypothetical protein
MAVKCANVSRLWLLRPSEDFGIVNTTSTLAFIQSVVEYQASERT